MRWRSDRLLCTARDADGISGRAGRSWRPAAVPWNCPVRARGVPVGWRLVMLAHAAELGACHISRTAATGARTIPSRAPQCGRGGGLSGALHQNAPKSRASPLPRMHTEPAGGAIQLNRQHRGVARRAGRQKFRQRPRVPNEPGWPRGLGHDSTAISVLMSRGKRPAGNVHASRNRQTH